MRATSFSGTLPKVKQFVQSLPGGTFFGIELLGCLLTSILY